MDIEKKEAKLVTILKEMGSVAVAFSGGVDSTYLIAIAKEALGEKAIALTMKTEYIPSRELTEARELAKQIGIQHKVITMNALSNEQISSNPPDRCFFCKTDIFSEILKTAEDLKLDYVLDGSNTDDLKDYRPGLRALKNLQIISPLKEAGLSKADIRLLSNKRGLLTWDKPSFSCLATRLPYHQHLTIERLKQIEQAEDYLFNIGIKQFRVRHHQDIARIEVLQEDFGQIITHSEEITEAFKGFGFDYVTLDLQGYRTGSLNDKLKKAE